MNRNLIIVFLVVCSLAVGAIIVYAKNNTTGDSPKETAQSLFNFDRPGGKTGNLTPTMSQPQITELKIEDIKEGTGSAVVAGDTAEVHYTGTLLDGTKFDSSHDRNQTFEFKVGGGQVIAGWDQGLIGMKVGGVRKLTIPSDLAYGPQGAGGIIGPNTPLLFEVELVSIKSPQL